MSLDYGLGTMTATTYIKGVSGRGDYEISAGVEKRPSEGQ